MQVILRKMDVSGTVHKSIIMHTSGSDGSWWLGFFNNQVNSQATRRISRLECRCPVVQIIQLLAMSGADSIYFV